MPKCMQCGTNNLEGSKFCGGCGTKLAAVPVQPQSGIPVPGQQPVAPPLTGRPAPPLPGQPMSGGEVPSPPGAQSMPGGRPVPPPPTQAGRSGYAPPQTGYPGAPRQGNYGSSSAAAGQVTYNPAERTVQLGWKRSNAGIMCYAFGWLSGLIMFFVEKDPFVRFHAAQSVALFGGLTVLSMVLPTALPRGLYSAISPLMSLMSTASMVLWVVLMYKASKGEYYKLPIVGDVAERFAKNQAN